ncbi:MAG: hypothetical protein KF742_00190 [Cryobacterium sp.]|nr:hypothetical protein [Cryobacterium sp.]MBX3090465.1 hypothetical protein [Cryobacterium sp.]MCO5293812.1 hypothetical protein [Homoserinimonas sp.]MCW5945227.1 hypothetical protein [Cryobacterium sp.]
MVHGRSAVVIAVVALLLVGCAAGPDAPGSSPSGNASTSDRTPGELATPTPTAEPLAIERPAPLWSVSCAELGAMFGTSLDGMKLLDLPIGEVRDMLTHLGSWRDAVANQGGLDCVWTNDVGMAYLDTPNIWLRGTPAMDLFEARYLSIVALPGAAAGYRSLYGYTGKDFKGDNCQWNNTYGYTNADYEAAVGEDWIRINLMIGPTGCDQYWTPRVKKVIERIGQSRLSDPSSRPAGVATLPADCKALIAPVDALLSAPVGPDPYAAALYGAEPFTSLERSKLLCIWGTQATVVITALEGGAWLMPEYHAWAATIGRPVAIDATSLRPGDEAWMIPESSGWVTFWAALGGNLYRGSVDRALPPDKVAERMASLIDALVAWQGTP